MGPPGGDPGLDAPSLLAPKQPQVTIRQVPAHQDKAKDKNKEKEKEKEKKGNDKEEKEGPTTEQLKEATVSAHICICTDDTTWCSSFYA